MPRRRRSPKRRELTDRELGEMRFGSTFGEPSHFDGEAFCAAWPRARSQLERDGVDVEDTFAYWYCERGFDRAAAEAACTAAAQIARHTTVNEKETHDDR